MGLDDFVGQTAPRLEYAMGRALEAMGRTSEARQAYGRAADLAGQLGADTGAWSSQNFHVLLAVEKLGRKEEAARLLARFEATAKSALNAKSPARRAEARYLLALVEGHAGHNAEARKLMQDAVAAQPDALAPRLELRGDTLDRLQ
jgi:tetratricopeptide (TPR) repeat protein